jgi:hypothetical protein
VKETNDKPVHISLTATEAIALNNFTMDLLRRNERDADALGRASKKLLEALNDADPIDN